MPTILGIRRGEFVEIIRVSFPAESFTDVENRESISPYHKSALLVRSGRGMIRPGLCMSDRMPVNECRWWPSRAWAERRIWENVHFAERWLFLRVLLAFDCSAVQGHCSVMTCWWLWHKGRSRKCRARAVAERAGWRFQDCSVVNFMPTQFTEHIISNRTKPHLSSNWPWSATGVSAKSGMP